MQLTLTTMHPIQLGPIDLETPATLDLIQTSLSQEYPNLSFAYEDIESPELFSHFFPQCLKIQTPRLESGATTLRVFSGGVSVLTHTKTYEFSSLDDLIKDVESLRISIESNSALEEIMQSICDQRGNWHTIDIEQSTKPKLLWAYCQILSAENFGEPLHNQIFGNDESRADQVKNSKYDDLSVSMSPSLVTIQSNVPESIQRVQLCLSTVTLMTALLYQIQTRALMISRDILAENGNVKDQFDSLELYVRAVNIFDQLVAEFKQNDFLGNAYEEAVAYPLAKLWQFDELVVKTESAVLRLKSHISSLEGEMARISQKRTNNILFIFTLISIMTVTGSIIGLYDTSQDISPLARLAMVFGNFIAGSALIVWFIKRPKIWRKLL